MLLVLATLALASDTVDELEVYPIGEVLRCRAEVFAALKEEGWRERGREGEYTVFASKSPWKPQVLVHDDGWVRFRRQPPRVHAPGRAFADQGNKANYLWCALLPTACVSIGGWVVGPRKYGAIVEDVADATRDEVRAMNDAVARRELGRRLNEDIPADLEAIWARRELPPAERRALLFEYWDSRTDTPSGEEARTVIEAFLRGVVMTSDEPYTPEELAGLNAHRTTASALELPSR